MRVAWLVGVVAVLLWAGPAQAAVVSVNADGVMDVQVPEGGDLRVECAKPPGGDNYCDVLFSSSTGGQVTGVAPACLPQTIGGRVRCTGVTSRNVTMGSGADRLTLTTSASVGYGGLFGGTITMGGGDDTVVLGESYGSDLIAAGAGTDTVRYAGRFATVTVTAGGGGTDGSFGEADDVRAEVVEGGRGADVLIDVAGTTTLLGADGHDTLTGGSGANTLDGGLGNDTIDGGGGADALTGGPNGLPGFLADGDRLTGGDGDDVLHGGSGADSLGGGTGSDALFADDGAGDRLDCGEQEDTAKGDRIDYLENCETEDLGAPIELSVADVAVDESAGDAVLTIVASGPNGRAMSARVVTEPGTAGGEDFVAQDLVVTVPPGATSTEVRVPIAGDDLDENDVETFGVRLGEPVQAIIGDGEAAITIRDDDDPPVVALDPVADVAEGAAATVTARLSTASGLPVTVDLVATDGSASRGADYLFPEVARITIPAGALTGTTDMATVADGVDEDDETFDVRIDGSPGNAIPAGEPRPVTILDRDAAPVLSIADAEVSEGDEAAVRISQSAVSQRPVTVRVRTGDGTALATGDYTPVDRVVTIPAGEQHVVVPISTTEDTRRERDEAFTVSLSEPVNADLARSTAAVTIRDDDSKDKPRPR